MAYQKFTEFIIAHEADSPAELMLHRDRWPDIDMTEAVKCIQGRVKARSKLPLWYAEPGLVYPQSLSLEQCSSQATALYKQRFVNSGDRVADLTGGLGVDSWSLSQAAASVDYFERSEELCACARHNFSALGRSNITVRHAETTPEMLGNIPSDSYSLIYLDPARRGKDGGRVYSLRDCEPDITVLRHELLRIAPRILLKASPMADIRVLLSELPEAAKVRIVSHNNECKEVLILMQRGHSASPEDIPITAVEISDDNASQTAVFHFSLREETEAVAELAAPSEITGFLYEPSPARHAQKRSIQTSGRPLRSAENLRLHPFLYSSGTCRAFSREDPPHHRGPALPQGRYPRFPEEIPVLLRHRPQLSHDLRRAPPSPRHFRKRHPPRPGHHRLRQLPPPHYHHNLILQGCTKNLHTRYTLKK